MSVIAGSAPGTAPTTLRNAPLPGGARLDHYRIEQVISSGGFSIVYRARDDEGERVVIKEYLPAALAQRAAGELVPRVPEKNRKAYGIGLRSFFAEGRALASIRHPNIIRVRNFFRANETVYLVMDHAVGRSLQDHVRRHCHRNRPDVLPEGLLQGVFLQVLHGLREVHSKGLLHLDLKPANIFLRVDGTPLLLDFGAVHRALQRESRAAHQMYTPGFAAPELHRRGETLGPWTDAYGIGASLYNCMAGRLPQEAPKRALRDEMPRALHALRGLYSAELLALVGRCLSLQPGARPQSMFALQQELRAIPEPRAPGALVRLRALWLSGWRPGWREAWRAAPQAAVRSDESTVRVSASGNPSGHAAPVPTLST